MAATYYDRHGYAPREHINSGIHGCGRRPSRADLTPIDPDELSEWNRGTQRAILANRDRDARENLLDSLHTWRWRG